LSEQEIIDLTGYTVASYQIKSFQKLGIPVLRRPNGSVLVMRMHCHYPVPWIYSPAPDGVKAPAPQRKSVRLAEEAAAARATEVAASAGGRRSKR
jgi:hypothetical protein